MAENKFITFNTPKCCVCKQEGLVRIPESEFRAWKNGALIQDAMPTTDADTREQIITGTHKECWDKLFGKEE